MSTFIESNDHLEEWLADDLPPDLLLTPMSEESAQAIVDLLKNEADRYWSIDANYSLKYAERILAFGQARNDESKIALGLMAKGDAFQFLGQINKAWDMLEQAGSMFEKAGNEVGWARTCIGRVYLSPNLNRVSEALADAARAHEIFSRHNDEDKLMRLEWQTGLVHNSLGNQQYALKLFNSAMGRAKGLGDQGQKYIGTLYENIGLTFNALGDFHQALAYYEKAQAFAVAKQETRNIARIESSIAEIAQAQGHYRRALALLNSGLEKVKNRLMFDATLIQYHMVECYLSLNRNADALELAHIVIENCRTINAEYELARTLLFLTTIEATSGNFAAAEAALLEAEPIFASRGATSWMATIRLWRGRMALKQGNAALAYQESVTAAAAFEADDQQVNDAAATLLRGQALFALEDYPTAESAGNKTRLFAQRYNLPSLRYEAYLLLGQIAEARGKHTSAMHHYKAAAATIERVQRELTITLRPGFLEDKGEALRRLISLYLRTGHTVNAFETLENAKAQNWLAYLNNRERLHWSQEDAASRALIEELEGLRAEHQWFYRLSNHLPGNSEEYPKAITPEQALAEMTNREQRMRAITEQLYLRNEDDPYSKQTLAPSFNNIQQALDNDSTLIEYYTNGDSVWAFTLNRNEIQVHRLPMTMKALSQVVEQWQANIAGALKMDPYAAGARKLTMLAQRILQRLHASLIQPLVLKKDNCRLVFVPYGVLHFLPFHLLHDGSEYLIEKHEILTLPAAGLVTRRAPKRAPGVLALAHSGNGKLPHTAAEAQVVQKLFGGNIRAEEHANRTALGATPVQILHIATHGQHRLDQPDLSFLQLADGQLYADDVLQKDLSYELVTLSACETGRARVMASDDLIGMGRSFLYAGAGALVLSLWHVGDQATLRLMKRMYAALYAGASKPSALRQAQMSILAENKDIHPAFWGAFQVVGNADPLSR
ncbi:MAG: CHAT domain-containing protein [Anaerolineae bacterium]|nr:CHAT domain-containing protein [Anaerolineae bacterium]